MTNAIRADVYQRITDRIVADLEAGVRPWLRPWNAEHAAGRITRPLRANGVPYRGINVVALWMEAAAKGFAAPIWMTYKQANERGGQVRKGERGSLVVYADTITRTETDAATGTETESEIPFLKGYTVFCVDQIDGLPAQYYAKAAPVLDPVQRIAGAEAFFAATGATIRHGGTQAFYSMMRIPRQSGHRFRRKAATQSDRKRPPNPNEGGHPVDGVIRGALSAV